VAGWRRFPAARAFMSLHRAFVTAGTTSGERTAAGGHLTKAGSEPRAHAVTRGDLVLPDTLPAIGAGLAPPKGRRPPDTWPGTLDGAAAAATTGTCNLCTRAAKDAPEAASRSPASGPVVWAERPA